MDNTGQVLEDTSQEGQEEGQEIQEGQEQEESQTILDKDFYEFSDFLPIHKQLTFLSLAVSKDKTRGVLRNICSKDGNLYATDGHRLHYIEKPDAVLKAGYWQVVKANKKNIVINYVGTEDDRGDFPDCNRVIPNTTKHIEVSPSIDIAGVMFQVFTKTNICMKLKYFQDAIYPFNEGHFTCEYIDEKSPVLFTKADELCKSVVMPILI